MRSLDTFHEFRVDKGIRFILLLLCSFLRKTNKPLRGRDKARRVNYDPPRRAESATPVAVAVFLYMSLTFLALQRTSKRLRPGLVNFVTALAYHFCLNLSEAFTKPGRSLFADPCTPIHIAHVSKILVNTSSNTTPKHRHPSLLLIIQTRGTSNG